jgi:gas vesicle protein
MGKIDNVVLIAIGSFIAGVLLAPKSGKETRKDIMDKTHEFKDKATDSFREVKKGASSVKDHFVDGIDSVKDIATDASTDARYSAIRLKDEVAQHAEAIRLKAQQTSDEVKRSRS